MNEQIRQLKLLNRLRTFSNKHKPKEESSLMTVNLVELAAMEKKHSGKRYKVIVRELNDEFASELGNRPIKLQRIKHWFMCKGKLFGAYLEYVERKNTSKVREGETLLNSEITDAVLKVKHILEDPAHPQAFKAANLVIKSVFGPPGEFYKKQEKEKAERELKEAIEDDREKRRQYYRDQESGINKSLIN